MIEILSQSKGNFIGAKASGFLTDQDYKEVLIPHLERVMKEKGKVRFLLDLGQAFQGWTLEALWEDAIFGWGSRKNFEKFALVGGSFWMEFGAKAGGLLMDGEIRTFAHDHLDEAWDWITSRPNTGGITQPTPVSPYEAQKGTEEPITRKIKPAKEKNIPKANPHHSYKRTNRR